MVFAFLGAVCGMVVWEVGLSRLQGAGSLEERYGVVCIGVDNGWEGVPWLRTGVYVVRGDIRFTLG